VIPILFVFIACVFALNVYLLVVAIRDDDHEQIIVNIVLMFFTVFTFIVILALAD
jgi:hypothetical protein